MLKVMTIVGTRPELIKMSRVIAELDRQTRHVLVHTGQNYGCGWRERRTDHWAGHHQV